MWDELDHFVTTLLWHCGVYGRTQQERLARWARDATVAADLRRLIEAQLTAEHPLLPHLRERVAAGGYADDCDTFTPLERERLRFAVWLRETGRIGE